MTSKKRVIIGVIVLFVIMLGRICMNSKTERGLFSWEKDAIVNSEKLFEDMEKLGITEVYQYMSDQVEPETMKEFLVSGKEREIEVFYLTGEPDWAFAELEEALIEEIDKVIAINKLAGQAAFKGIVFDVEPHALNEWQENTDELMKSYVNNMKNAYVHAAEHDIMVILCIPYYYDILGYIEELETLITDACDGIAIMNYYRDMEISNMEAEAAYASKHDKFIITIYEMKEAGTYGLTEKNTYHELGFKPVIENFKELCKSFRGQSVKMAYHDYEAVKEVMQKNRK